MTIPRNTPSSLPFRPRIPPGSLRNGWQFLGVALLIILFGIVLIPLAQSDNYPQVLKDSWTRYKTVFIQSDGRVMDPSSNVTTSEGQSYALMRAVWMNDPETYQRVYQWTNKNLLTRKDRLYSWKWGRRQDNSWGVIDIVSATDADQDIALALLLASKRWESPRYKVDAIALLNDIWEKETQESALGRVLIPGDWPNRGGSIQLNPSYFAPYAYRVFAEADPAHPWQKLVDSSYTILRQVMEKNRTNLPPDWVEFSFADGNLRLYMGEMDARSDYGYEAFRIYWRVALDTLLNPNEKRGDAILKRSNFLSRFWHIRQALPEALTMDGIERHTDRVAPALYGGDLFALIPFEPNLEPLIRDKILPGLREESAAKIRNDYYAQNWLWFGLAQWRLWQDVKGQRNPLPAKGGSSLDKMESLLR